MTKADRTTVTSHKSGLPFGSKAGLYSFVFASFLGSFLLFSIQPLFARRALPLLGGTAVVWNTAMVFFQAGLLAGYSLVHLLALKLGLRKQRVFLMVVYLAAAIFLPIGIASGWHNPPAGAGPVWLMAFFAASIGLPYLAVAVTAPLLQCWYRHAGADDAHDPYWLYAASNIGSFVALMAYPFFIEPAMKLRTQELVWGGLFAGLVVFMLALVTRTAHRGFFAVAVEQPAVKTKDRNRPALKRILYWMALTFVPCSLLLSVTTWMTEDLAAIPLLWVVPLAVYQLSYVLAFAKRPLLQTRAVAGLVAPALFIGVFVFYHGFGFRVSFTTFLAVLFVVCWSCHQTLADNRPPARFLTTFYICLAFGGMAGGFFNTFVAPIVFNDLYELHLVMLLAVLLIPSRGGIVRQYKEFWKRVYWPRFWVTYLLLAIVGYFALPDVNLWGWIMLGTGTLLFLVAGFRARRLYAVVFVFFTLWLGSLHWLQTGWGFTDMTFLAKVRSHYGRYSVVHAKDGEITGLRHGTTLHGIQVNLPELEHEPNSYYDKNGPVGQMFSTLFALEDDTPVVGVLGLGIGNLVCYSKDKGKRWTFYEIDPLIEKLARNSDYFRAISGCGPQSVIKTGDGRLLVEAEPDNKFDILFIDAFNSDSVPVHLITTEALDIYMSKVKKNGVVMVNLSNNYADVKRIIAGYAGQRPDVYVRIQSFETLMDRANNYGTPSTWGILSRSELPVSLLAHTHPDWNKPETVKNPVVWTDDHVNLFGILKW